MEFVRMTAQPTEVKSAKSETRHDHVASKEHFIKDRLFLAPGSKAPHRLDSSDICLSLSVDVIIMLGEVRMQEIERTLFWNGSRQI